MFAARFPGTCTNCKVDFPAGTQVQKAARGYRHVVCEAKQRPGSRPAAWTAVRKAAEANALENAVIAREVAEDDYFRAVYVHETRFHGFGPVEHSLEQSAVDVLMQAMVDARMAAMLEADAVGIINLFDPVEPGTEAAWLRIADVLVFGGVTNGALDAAMGNAFGAAEAEQEREAYMAKADRDAAIFG